MAYGNRGNDKQQRRQPWRVWNGPGAIYTKCFGRYVQIAAMLRSKRVWNQIGDMAT